MEFRETLLAAQRNQQEKSSVSNYYYKAKFDPPKKEQREKDRLSANIQKFLAKKDEEERQKKLDAQRKREELAAMRDPKALRKIQKTLKVIKSANKSVIADAVDRDNTAVTREGPDQPDQDDYGYESQSAAAIYEKMMQKYSKMPDEPKFPTSSSSTPKDLHGTRERVKHALRHEDDPVPHKRKRRTENGESSPPQKYEPEREKEKDKKSDKPKIRRPAPPPMDFNQLLKLAEQKKSEPIDISAPKKTVVEPEPDRLMTKKQKREYEEEMARRQRRQERIEAAKAGQKVPKADKPTDKERKPEPTSTGFGRIPKVGERAIPKSDPPRSHEREKKDCDREKAERVQKEKEKARLERDKVDREKDRMDKERLDKLKAERDRIEREMERLNKDRERLDKTKAKLETSISSDRSKDRPKSNKEQPIKQEAKKNIDLKSQNTYRIDKNDRKLLPQKQDRLSNGHSSLSKPVPKLSKESLDRNMKDKMALAKKQLDGSPRNGQIKLDNGKRLPEAGRGLKKGDDKKSIQGMKQGGSSKPVTGFDFDQHVNSIGRNGGKKLPPSDNRRKQQSNDKVKQKRRMVDSDSEYDSEMDDFIDDGDVELDYSSAIKEIFGYDKSRYRDMDDADDPSMESSFARQQREEYITKKIGIMEDLEDMRMEAMEKKKKGKRRISDD
ncbi:protein SPT2 homolog [Pieris brassicae]|uniref:Protein SPT2 homolog n=1 Tax=Pieris brassicae TaxID=7116 RepID=A0A9P0TPG3_PIEBR|nr:protein SPT2 homolog [Pieris brassicae]CAH4036102.1 unnamed protein product [Pieris brassicae]